MSVQGIQITNITKNSISNISEDDIADLIIGTPLVKCDSLGKIG